MLTIIDTGIANVGSIKYKLFNHGLESIIGNSPEDITNSSKLILPGVGNFKEAMNKLEQRNLIQSLHESVLDKKIPILGICLGMQLFANNSEEGQSKGLGWLDANVEKFDKSILNMGYKIPHVGWNEINISNSNLLFDNIPLDHKFYFTHSYHMVCNNKEDR